MKIYFFLLLSINIAIATLGVDYSTRLNVETVKCLHQAGYHFAIPRGYCSYGGVDRNVVENLKDAWSAGMPYVDVYLFPCVKCGNPAGQVDQLISALSHSTYGMIWLDVETYQWTSSHQANQAFITAAINQIKARGKKPGMYTNKHNWDTIVGSWSGESSLPLWYAHYDNQRNFNDFRAFGGWNKPAMKQFAGTTRVCGAGVDLSFY